MEKLIITIAPTGNVPTKEMNPNTPITVEEIANDIEKCYYLGAAIAHIHVRDEAGLPTCDRELYRQVLDTLEEKKLNMITQVSTGARGGGSSAEWRGQMLDLNAEMASLATGSSNFVNGVNANSPELIEYLVKKMNEHGVKPEIEAFDTAMIDNAKYLMKRGILKPPLQFNLVMNVPGSIAGTPKNLLHMVEILPPDSTWTVMGVGKKHLQMMALAIAMGGNVRTGLEDVLVLPDGTVASNEILIKKVLDIAAAIGRPIATPDEARKILSLR